jgi:hypothetical protein
MRRFQFRRPTTTPRLHVICRKSSHPRLPETFGARHPTPVPAGMRASNGLEDLPLKLQRRLSERRQIDKNLTVQLVRWMRWVFATASLHSRESLSLTAQTCEAADRELLARRIHAQGEVVPSAPSFQFCKPFDCKYVASSKQYPLGSVQARRGLERNRTQVISVASITRRLPGTCIHSQDNEITREQSRTERITE